MIELICGDITQAKVDAIVNAANCSLLGGGGVDGAIHRAAGPELLAACQALPEVDGVRCPTGEARLTPAGNLSAQYVIHTVGPIYDQVRHPERLLAKAYESSLELAEQTHCNSIAFPAISCGVYGFPHDEAAFIALNTCLNVEIPNLHIQFYLFKPLDLTIWQHTLNSLL